MEELIKQLIEKRAQTWDSAKALLDKAEADKREMDAAEQEAWDRMGDELTKLDARVGDLTEKHNRNKQADEVRAQFAEVAKPPAAPGTPDKPAADDEALLRRLVNREVRSVELKPHGRVARTKQEQREQRDLVKGTTTAGGFTVPTGFVSRLYEILVEASGLRQTNVTVLNTDSGEDIQLPKITSYSTAGIVAEGGLKPESDPVFAQITLGAFKYAFLIQASEELVQDSGIDLVDFFSRQGGRALAQAADLHYISGNGTTQPNGIVTAASVGVTGGAGVAGAFTADNLIDLFFSVIAEYRRQGWWLMADSALKTARKLKDTTNQYLWEPGLTLGEESTLLGRPVVSDTNVADVALSAKSVIFGDMSAYYIRDVNGVRIERSDDFAFATDLITWRFILRTDGDLVDTSAVKVFQGNAA